jgi:hypothetical protein
VVIANEKVRPVRNDQGEAPFIVAKIDKRRASTYGAGSLE